MPSVPNFRSMPAQGVDPALVPCRTLSSRVEIPAIGLGTFGSDRVSHSAVADAVRYAASIGYRHFDFASVYGNEEQIGRVHKLRHAMVRPGRDRLQGHVEVDEAFVGGEEEGVHGRQTETKAMIAFLKDNNKTASELMPRVHLAVALLKRWLLGTHQGGVSMEHLDAYLDEFASRFNRRKSRSRGKLFYRLLEQAVAVEPVPYRSLVKCSAMPPFNPSIEG